jgi:hypothetical protein
MIEKENPEFEVEKGYAEEEENLKDEDFKMMWEFASMLFGEENLKKANIENYEQLEDFIDQGQNHKKTKNRAKKSKRK